MLNIAQDSSVTIRIISRARQLTSKRTVTSILLNTLRMHVNNCYLYLYHVTFTFIRLPLPLSCYLYLHCMTFTFIALPLPLLLSVPLSRYLYLHCVTFTFTVIFTSTVTFTFILLRSFYWSTYTSVFVISRWDMKMKLKQMKREWPTCCSLSSLTLRSVMRTALDIRLNKRHQAHL